MEKNRSLPEDLRFAAISKMSELKLPRTALFRGEVHLPGSKSIANRALLLAALAEGKTELRNLPASDDVRVLMNTLPRLGVAVEKSSASGQGEGTTLLISGAGGPFPVKNIELNLENAGTAFRPLTAVLSAGSGEYTLDGDAQMRKRPIADLVRALASLGVSIECSSEGTPPVRIRADGLPGGVVSVSGKVSSQFVSALLLAAPLVRKGELIIELPEDPVSKPYIDLTLGMMEDFGVSVSRDSYTRFVISGSAYRSPGVYTVEGDASAATYFLSAGAISGCGPVTVHGLSQDSRQGDIRYAEVLQKMGAHIEYGPDWIRSSGAPNGLNGITVDMNDMPDAAMTLAVLALFARGETHILNIANLRVKESERIRGVRTELEKLGAEVTEEPDALHIRPPESLKPASIATYRDHRMAMAFSLASFGTDIVIENPACVSKTYPDYFQDFVSVAYAKPL